MCLLHNLYFNTCDCSLILNCRDILKKLSTNVAHSLGWRECFASGSVLSLIYIISIKTQHNSWRREAQMNKKERKWK